jgi:iron complex outermembrane receptor protein
MRSRIPFRLSGAAAAALLSNTVLGQTVLEEIHVTGVPLTQSPEELAQSVTVLTGETLDRMRAANLGETLAAQVGVSASYFGAGASRPIIRGLAGARVRTLEDGIDAMDIASVSIDHAVTIDPIVAQQIEIFRGPTTLLYGSGAVGGVVNTVTNRLPEIAPEDGFDGIFEVRGDTVAADRSAALALDGGGDRFAWHVDALTRNAGDYAIPGFAELEPDADSVLGVLENSSVQVDSGAVGASWLGDNGFFSMSVSRFDTNYGVPSQHAAAGGVGAADEGDVRIDLGQTRIDLKGGWLAVSDAIQAINLRVGANDYGHVELEGGATGTRFANDSLEGRLEVMHSPWGAWTGAFGIQFGDRQFSAEGEEAFVPPVDTRTYGLFVIEQREAGAWNLSLGARVESQTHAPTGGAPRHEATAASYSIAAIRQLSERLSLALNAARAERLPVADELYANGPHLASGNVEIGDPALHAEVSNHVDLGIRKTAGGWTWSVTAFRTRFDDFIYLRETGDIEPDSELPIFVFAQQSASFHGFEAEAFSPVADLGSGELDVRVFVDGVTGRLGNGEYVPRLPPGRVGARLQYHNDHAVIGIEAARYDAQTRLAPIESVTPGYTMVDADFSWSMPLAAGGRLEYFLRGANLLDEDARRHTSFAKAFAPLPGRNFALGVRAVF